MKKSIILFLVIGQLSFQSLIAQSDTTISRVVTVERDFQPVIQNAGKINQRPEIISHEIPLNPVVYSTYSDTLSIGNNLNTMRAAEVRFVSQTPLQGVLEAAGGYRNTHLRLGYQVHKKDYQLRLNANHDGYWGADRSANANAGINYTQHFSEVDLYVNTKGDIDYWNYYVKMPYDTFGIITWDAGNRIVWDANANIGIVSTNKKNFQYRIQTGYSAIGQMYDVEHIINSHLDLGWSDGHHSAGIKAQVKNNLYKETVYAEGEYDSDFPDYTYIQHSRHALRMNPFYEYRNKSIHVRAGVHIDINIDPFIGDNKWLSNMDKLGFAPSPDIQINWHTKDNIFHAYAHATGSYGTAMIDEKLEYNRFGWYAGETNYIAHYTPVDATIGIKLRPINTFLLDIHGGYALQLGQYNTYTNVFEEHKYLNAISTDYYLNLNSYQEWKIGASLHYHYRDIIELNAAGNYYFFRPIEPNNPQPVAYDRPNWDAQLRLDVHINSKWSLYSENQFAGSRLALTNQGDKTLAPIILLNVGGQYAINRWLFVYAQLNDYLNRKHDIFYGYKSQGIHFLLGVKWQF